MLGLKLIILVKWVTAEGELTLKILSGYTDEARDLFVKLVLINWKLKKRE